MVDNVKFAGAVEVDDWHEGSRMTIEEEFDGGFVAAFVTFVVIVVVVVFIMRFHGVVVAEIHEVVDGRTSRQSAESRLGNALERRPGELVTLAADVDDHPRRRTCRPARRQRRHGRQSAGAGGHDRRPVMGVRRRREPVGHRVTRRRRRGYGIDDDRRGERQRRRRYGAGSALLQHGVRHRHSSSSPFLAYLHR